MLMQNVWPFNQHLPSQTQCLPKHELTMSGHSISPSGHVALMISILLTLAERPLLLVTEKVMLYTPAWSGLMPHASSTGTSRFPLDNACHLNHRNPSQLRRAQHTCHAYVSCDAVACQRPVRCG